MTALVDNVWELLENECVKFQINPCFHFDIMQKQNFKNIITDHKKKILDNYMDETVENLDRHKIAALIIISLLETNAISYEGLNGDQIFIGSELLALKVGLAYMMGELNKKLAAKGIKHTIKKFYFPNAQSCPTSYIEIICRNLYYTKTDYNFNPLDLADRLFLLEYITLLKEDIDSDKLKDYKEI